MARGIMLYPDKGKEKDICSYPVGCGDTGAGRKTRVGGSLVGDGGGIPTGEKVSNQSLVRTM